MGLLQNGSLSLRSTYLLARGLNPLNLETMSLSLVWKVDTTLCIQFFLWLCMHNSIPTCEVLGSRGLNLSPNCPLCLKGNETIDRLLKGCELDQSFWQKLKFLHFPRDSFNKPVGEWLETNCKTDILSNFMGIPWRIVFLMGVWHLWL